MAGVQTPNGADTSAEDLGAELGGLRLRRAFGVDWVAEAAASMTATRSV